MQIVPTALTAEAFAPFGDVIGLGPQSAEIRQNLTAAMDNLRDEAELNVSVVRHQPTALPLRLEWLEIHPHSAQTFVPMEIARYLILVCPTAADGGPQVSEARAFIGGPGQGITYKPKVWHHPFTVLDAPSQCVVLRYDAEDEEDTLWFEVQDGPSVADLAGSAA